MPRYRIMHRYSSGDFGPFEKGTEVELTEEDAEWLEHDSPGVTELIDTDAEKAKRQEADREEMKKYERKTTTSTTTRRGNSGRRTGGGS